MSESKVEGERINKSILKPSVPRQIKPSKPPSESGDHDHEICIIIDEIENFRVNSNDISNVYMGQMTYYSITLDIVTIYLKGQKLLYIESKTYCEMCLYFLMLPAIFISACCTVLSISLKIYQFGSIIVSALTAVNSFILGIVTYLKLDAKSEAHKTATYQFDKLQTRCEFYSGRILMIKDPDVEKNIIKFFDDIEKKVTEIKDINQFPVPEHIRRKYAQIYGQNVFSDMKIHKTIRNKNIQRLLIIDNLIKNYDPSIKVTGKPKKIPKPINIKTKWSWSNDYKNTEEQDSEDQLYTYTLDELKHEKICLLNEIIEYRNVSIKMNKIFDEEIKRHIEQTHMCCCKCKYFCLKT